MTKTLASRIGFGTVLFVMLILVFASLVACAPSPTFADDPPCRAAR